MELVVDVFESDVCEAHEFCFVLWVEDILHADGVVGGLPSFFGVDDLPFECFFHFFIVIVFIVDMCMNRSKGAIVFPADASKLGVPFIPLIPLFLFPRGLPLLKF